MKVYIGWDKREQQAYDACVSSIRDNTNQAVDIYPIKQEELREEHLYYRDTSEVVSTEFAFTRFLVPSLANYDGWALFVDCDFIFTRDISELFYLAIDDRMSVMCVHHDYVPSQKTKMDGQVQVPYPRKNWSSLMLFNCAHPFSRRLTPESVSTESAGWLHEMRWAEDAVGEIPSHWNWLVGEYNLDEYKFYHRKNPKKWPMPPSAIHYTNGCPFMDGYENCHFADQYWKYSNG